MKMTKAHSINLKLKANSIYNKYPNRNKLIKMTKDIEKY